MSPSCLLIVCACVHCVLRVQVLVYKMRPKKHYRRKNGHRQELSKFKVTSIN